jgi:hypothetical protein
MRQKVRRDGGVKLDHLDFGKVGVGIHDFVGIRDPHFFAAELF